MHGWSKLLLDNVEIMAGLELRICDACEKLFLAAGAPGDAALFSTKTDSREVHVLYFSPHMASLCSSAVARFEPEPSDRPSEGDVTVLISKGDGMALLR